MLFHFSPISKLGIFNFLDEFEVHLDCLFQGFLSPILFLKIGKRFFIVSLVSGILTVMVGGLFVTDVKIIWLVFIYYILMGLAGSYTVWLDLLKLQG